nr:hypothetical protein Iba_chr14bCG14550 [Ipomoea batatas]
MEKRRITAPEKQRSRGHWKLLQLAGRSEEEYGSREKHRKAVALLREPPEVTATEDPATLNCCRNFAPLPSPALRVEVFPRRKPPAAGGRRRDWRRWFLSRSFRPDAEFQAMVPYSHNSDAEFQAKKNETEGMLGFEEGVTAFLFLLRLDRACTAVLGAWRRSWQCWLQ